MARYLMAAEADQIQDFVFKATHLREVVGASQILTRFGDRRQGAPVALHVPDGDLVVSGGGSFRVLFDAPDQARLFGQRLAEVYHRATNGSMTVISEPEEVDEDDAKDFRRAGCVVQERLRAAKRQREGSWATAQFPFVAFCTSCGVGLATRHTKRHEKEDQAQYLCDACLAKGAERAEESLGEFLEPFVKAVVGEGKNLRQCIWPGKDRPGAGADIDPTADVGAFDPRRYVAYLVADGNNIGQIFDQCSKRQMRQLSENLTETLRASLAQTTRALQRAQPEVDEDFVPVLPLILGGDDLFALLPAPWALDFARHFCIKFEERMTRVVDDLDLPQRHELPERITASAAVVVCKANYPFYLAHAVGAERLDQAKQLAKQWAQKQRDDAMRSVVDFEVILGSQARAKSQEGTYRATLRPYWATGTGVPAGWGVKLDAVVEQRHVLRNLPRKRLSQLRALYYPSALPQNDGDLPHWTAQRDALFQRIGRDDEVLKQVKAAFTALGGESWHTSNRAADNDWYGHGLPDLLEAWDFAYRLDTPRKAYEEV